MTPKTKAPAGASQTGETDKHAQGNPALTSQSTFLVSMVSHAQETATSDADAIGIIEAIRIGKWREPVEAIRAEFSRVVTETGDIRAAKTAIGAAKKKLPGFLPSGQFSSRKKPAAEKLLKHSALLCADLDDLGERLASVRAKLTVSPHLWALFTSPTGNGLKAIFHVAADAARHTASFRAVEYHVSQVCGEKIDQACSDVARLCFVSDDSEAFLNTTAAELPPLPESAKPAAPTLARQTPTQGVETRRTITAEILGAIQWDSDTHGFCTCPGQHLHTSGEAERDCEVHLDKTPTIYCFHSHCTGIISAVNRELRSRIGKAEFKSNSGNTPSEYLSVSDEEAIAYLATLSGLDLDRCINKTADTLGCNVGTLRTEVEKRRRANVPNASEVKLQPWQEPVNGAELLEQIAATYERFCVLPLHASLVLAVWLLQTYCYRLFDFVSVIAVWSPEPECGKGRVLDVTEAIASHPFRTSNTSAAVLYHSVAKGEITVLIDELDSQSEDQREAISNILKSGFQANGKAHRMTERNGEQVAIEFSTFAPKMIATIGVDTLDKATRTRSIGIRMSRKPRDSKIAKFRRFDGTEIRRKCLRWRQDNAAALQAVPPMDLAECATDRQEDVWEPLVAIARTAGGELESRVREAARHLSGSASAAAVESVGHQLLAAIREYFISNTITRSDTESLLKSLNGKGEFSDLNRGRGLTPHFLAKQLRPYGIASRDIGMVNGHNRKGYWMEDCEEAFNTYLAETAVSKGYSATKAVNIDASSLFQSATEVGCSGLENAPNPNKDKACSGVADQKLETGDKLYV